MKLVSVLGSTLVISIGKSGCKVAIFVPRTKAAYATKDLEDSDQRRAGHPNEPISNGFRVPILPQPPAENVRRLSTRVFV